MEKTLSAISHFAPVIAVPDVQAAMQWYKEKLSFNITFTWNDPIDYAVLKRGENINLHLTRSSEFSKEKIMRHTMVYFFVSDVDAIHAEFKARGVENISNPVDHEYGMRDFDVVDLNGYRLSFGRGE